MAVPRTIRAPRPIALAGAAALLGGCLPWRYVAREAPPPVEVAREAATATPPGPTPTSPAPAVAQTQPRSLPDLVDLALARDPSTRATWLDARAAAAQAGSRWSAYLPTVDANANVFRLEQGGSPIPLQQGGSALRPGYGQTSWVASAAVTWLLLDAGARGALVDEAGLLLVAARLAEHSAVADLVLRVQQSYFGYLGARALVDAQAAAARQAEANLAAAEGRQRAGLATIADVLQARTALSQSRLALQQLEGQALALRGALASLAGLPPTAELDVGALPAEVDARTVQPAVEQLLAAADVRNPDVGRAEATADAADARARASLRALWPTLAFQGSIAHNFYVDPIRTDTETWTAGLVLRLPLLDGLGLRPAYDALAARAAADAAHARADAVHQRVALDVWTSFQALRTAGQRIGSSRDLVDSARASAEVAQGRYKEGVGSILDLLTAQAALEQALAEDVRARADYLVALALLARASGRLDLPPAPGAREGPRTP